ncbi:MAG: glycosyltransferase [Proteobacteria bacterium]|nr:glycosyltransferase [Pseudomonadota bacterium]
MTAPPPRVSIAMTTFDGARYVEAQLESFASQSRLPDQLVVCDDGSRDDTMDRVRAFAARAPFAVHAEQNETHLETTPNFGKAVSLCDGDVIFLADQDDLWLPDKIESVVDVFSADPTVGAVFHNGRVVDESGRPVNYELWDSLWFSEAERKNVRTGRALEVFAKHVVAAGTTLAFRGRYRDLVLPFPDLHDCHDAWVSFLVTAVSGVRIVERNLIDYRLHGANQFGLQRFGLREQLDKARWQLDAGIFSHNVRFFRAARERLAAQTDPDRQPALATLDLIDAKIAHARARDAMSSRLLERLPTIAGEVRSRGYWRFSYGWKSVAQDVLLR